MADQYANGARTTLAAPCGAGDGTITVASAATFVGAAGNALTGPFRVLVADLSIPGRVGNAELMGVTVSGGVWNVTRAAEYYAGSQQALSHRAGEAVTLVGTAGQMANADSAVSVAAYGADPTGATDSTAALQAAINAAPAGSRVYAPLGTYLITGLVSNTTGLTFDCRAATFVLKAGSSKFMLRLTASGQKVLGGTWDGNKAGIQVTTGGNAFYDHAAVAIQADDCQVRGAYSLNSAGIGFKAANCQRPKFLRCRATLPELYGTYIEATTVDVVGAVVRDCDLDVSSNALTLGCGIALPSANGFWVRRYKVLGNDILGALSSPQSGSLLIYARATRGVISGNTTLGGRMGCSLDSNQGSTVSGNVFDSPSECPLEIPGSLATQAATGNTITGNTLIGGQYGVEASGALGNTTLTGNTITGASVAGVYMTGSGTAWSGLAAEGNTITGCPSAFRLVNASDVVLSGNNLVGTDAAHTGGGAAFDLEESAARVALAGNNVRDFQYGLNFFATSSGSISDTSMNANVLNVATASTLSGAGAWGANVKIFNNSGPAGATDFMDRASNIFNRRDSTFTTPEAQIVAGVGSVYFSLASGRQYLKRQGTSSSGWLGQNETGIGTVTGTSYSVAAGDDGVLVDATAGPFALAIPNAAVFPRRFIWFTKIDSTANVVTITPIAGNAIIGRTTLTFQGDAIQYRSDGVKWYVTG